MKSAIFSVLFLALVFAAKAQNKPNEDSVITRMKDDVCAELAKIPASDFTPDNFQMKLGVQMLGVFQKYNDELVVLYGDDYMTDQAKAYEIGKKIGMQLGMSCKAFQEIIMKNPELVSAAMGKDSKEKKVQVQEEKIKDAPKAEVISVFGKVVSFTPSAISFYTIQTDDKKLVKVYWLQKFEGDDELISNPQRIIGKRVVFQVYEQKVFDAKEKIYKKLDTVFSYSDKVADETIMMAPAN